MSDLYAQAGRGSVFTFGPVSRGGMTIDLSLAGTKLWFTVKADLGDTDAEALILKTYVAGGASDGITVATTGSKNTGTITVPAAETAALEESVIAEWDLLLQEPGGFRSTLDEGIYRIRPAIGQPA